MLIRSIFGLFFTCLILFSCKQEEIIKATFYTRQLIDTIGFTQYNWQFDSIVERIDISDKTPSDRISKAVICPHDDYAYAAGLYIKSLEEIKAKTIILIGVAHQARNFNLENKLVFGSFDSWKSNDNTILVSHIRDSIINKLSKDIFIVHDSMMQLEHSLEAINPFLYRNNEKVKIIPILVPYITFENMNLFSDELSKVIYEVMKNEKLSYGKDLAIVISNDAVHYGNTDWGGSNLAPFGVDSIGNNKAKLKDLEIINTCLKDTITIEKIKDFNRFTVKKDNFKEYNWVWCGRYSVPFGLLLANKLNILINDCALRGEFIDYRSSYPENHLEVKDIGMGYTAPANNSHWVAYTGIKYN
jgi:AmmeMemoRadiSam system protein B